jgi:hypothetical protein
MEETLNDKYLGSRKIKTTAEEGATRGSAKLVRVFFDDDTSEVYSQLMLEAPGVVSKEAKGEDEFRRARVSAVAEKTLGLIRDYNLELVEIGYLGQLLGASLNESRDKADAHLWGVKDLRKITAVDLDRVLDESNKEQLGL